MPVSLVIVALLSFFPSFLSSSFIRNNTLPEMKGRGKGQGARCTSQSFFYCQVTYSIIEKERVGQEKKQKENCLPRAENGDFFLMVHIQGHRGK